MTARGRDRLSFGEDDIDLSAVEQIADRSQVAGIGRALALLGDGVLDGTITLAEGLDLLDAELDRRGTEALLDGRSEDVARPRRHEVAAALNRLRSCASGARERRSSAMPRSLTWRSPQGTIWTRS